MLIQNTYRHVYDNVHQLSDGALNQLIQHCHSELDKRKTSCNLPNMLVEEFLLRKVMAVKTYKERTGLSLQESIEAWNQYNRKQNYNYGG